MYEEDIEKSTCCYTMKQIEEKMDDYGQIFDIVRLIDEERISRMENNCDNQDPIDPCPCYSFWKKNKQCTNCITAKTIKDKRQRVKIEFSGTDSYQVISRYYNIECKNYVMELEYMNKKHWIDDIPVLLQCLVNIQDRIKAWLD